MQVISETVAELDIWKWQCAYSLVTRAICIPGFYSTILAHLYSTREHSLYAYSKMPMLHAGAKMAPDGVFFATQLSLLLLLQ